MASAMQLQSRASLPHLPQELQDIIVSLAVGHNRKCRGLLDLPYTCKRLRATCLPITYKQIELYGYLPKSCVDMFSPNTKHLELSKIFLNSSASLGQYIKTLELKGVELEQAIAEQILEHTTSLKSFIYRFEVQCNHDGLGTWPNA